LVRCVACAGVLGLLAFGTAAPAESSVVVTIDKSSQRMIVSVDGTTRHVFRVSTGRAGYGTPNGQFRPQRLERTWFSKKYYNSPMPHSIFFHGGFAIHGSYEISRLGGPASHGCVRLHPGDAARLFALVQSQGAGNTKILVSGANPVQTARQPRIEPQRAAAAYDPPQEARAFARPVSRPLSRAPIYQDPATGVFWIYGSDARPQIIAR
jgi:lipoprotein-anchoring transpeptidase ErfK/SrfK